MEKLVYPKRILVVEDDQEMSETLCEALVDHGYEPIAAANGQEALEQLRGNDEPPSIILLDLAIMSVYVILAGRTRRAAISPLWQRRFNRTGGAMLVGAGVFTATLKRQS